ncbi:GNAT family N-acetyltransferase [Alicyclobacillus pomorum]|jgi:ribosomal protein S18 acetylase RimI-like enzyme|uniref:GNAT family N-acetyltransferase n=1 Tax=Alicyclobacillus pomorum TaxID=204470 RepID=UPI000402AD11|nr:GNAT family N-acetyltransferase [Alicyclobacillus pomorum]
MRRKSLGKKSAVKRKKRKVDTSTSKPAKQQPADVLEFRARTPDDDDYIVQLTEEQLSGVHQQAFGEVFPREQFRRYLQSGAPTVVVEKAKKRIGYYSYLINPDGKMHISAMVIEPEYQSDGIGSKVMRHLEDEARRLGAHTLEVFVQTGNEKSLGFTRKLGFVQVFYVTPTTICFQKRLDTQVGADGHAPTHPRAVSQPAAPGYPLL